MTHVMQLVYEHEGTEEWECPECGRKLRIEWDPWKKETLVRGDETVSHSGGKGGLQVSSIVITG